MHAYSIYCMLKFGTCRDREPQNAPEAEVLNFYRPHAVKKYHTASGRMRGSRYTFPYCTRGESPPCGPACGFGSRVVVFDVSIIVFFLVITHQ